MSRSPSEDRITSGIAAASRRCRISRASVTPSISGMCRSRTATSNNGPSRKPPSASAGAAAARASMPQPPATSTQIRRFVALSSTISRRRPARCAWPGRSQTRGFAPHISATTVK
jgi:hypothetical protein